MRHGILEVMIKKLRILGLSEDQNRADLEFWLGRSTEERLSAVEILRRQFYGSGLPLKQ
jgi:hypothetical protein